MRPNTSFCTRVLLLDLTFREEQVTGLGQELLWFPVSLGRQPLRVDTKTSISLGEGRSLTVSMHSLSLASPSVSLLTPHPQEKTNKQARSHFGIKFYSFRQHMSPRVPGNTTLVTLVNALHQRPPHCQETHGMHYTR